MLVVDSGSGVVGSCLWVVNSRLGAVSLVGRLLVHVGLQKVDMMILLPPPEIGDMRAFFNEMTEGERWTWKARYAVSCLLKTPGFNSV